MCVNRVILSNVYKDVLKWYIKDKGLIQENY